MNKNCKWIKLSDRLPEMFKDILIFEPKTSNQKIHIARLALYGPDRDNMVVELQGGCIMTLDYFTHWMPLPEHPN